MNHTAALSAIEHREIGVSGIRASAIGLGTWAIGGWMWGGTDERASIGAIRESIDAGVTLIDTAPAYGMGRSEEIVGRAIAGRRDEVVPTTGCVQGKHYTDVNHVATQMADKLGGHAFRIRAPLFADSVAGGKVLGKLRSVSDVVGRAR
jgi:diketogulonate reductase-like aldo/keto reductase